MADVEKPVQNTEEEAEESIEDGEKVNDADMDANKNTKAKSKAKSEEEDESSEEEDEENPGLFDKPLVIEGKRERKKTEFFVKDEDEIKKPIPLQFNGTGDALGSMEVVNHEISRCTSFELKPLHKLLFGREGKEKEIKKNIRLFNGFKIEEGSKEYENKKFGLERFTMEGLKRMLEIFDLEKKGTREEYKERIFEFLLNPKETGRSLKTLQNKAKKKASKKKSSGKGEKRKRASSKPKKKPSKSKEEVEDDGSDEDEKASDKDSDDEIEQPKKKKAKTETPSKAKSTPKKSPTKSKKDTKAKKKSKPVTVKITAGKRTPKKTPEKAKKSAARVEDDDSSGDEPLSKKTKKQPPTNEEIASAVKELLKDADLDGVTVKSIRKEVFAKYPDFDLTEKKDFIKETVYSVIGVAAGESK